MQIDFNNLSADAFSHFSQKCSSCTRGKSCRLRIRVQRSLFQDFAVVSDSFSYSNTKDMDVLCSDFKESRKKKSYDLRRERFLNAQIAKESRGQLRLF
jgi:hypothetical protein